MLSAPTIYLSVEDEKRQLVLSGSLELLGAALRELRAVACAPVARDAEPELAQQEATPCPG